MYITSEGVLTEVTIEDVNILNKNYPKSWAGVQTIDKSSFALINDAFEIKIPKNVEIEWGTFSESAVKKVDLSDSNLNSLPSEVFKNCENLETVILPSSLIMLANKSFENCKNLTEIDLSNIEVIPLRCFKGCDNLAKVIFSKKLKEIGSQSFKETKIETLDFSNTQLSKIGAEAFSDCNSLKSVNLESGTEISLMGGVFENCSNLQKVNVSEKIKELSARTFNSCEKLETVIFNEPTTLNKVGAFCFNGCKNLRKIENLNTVREIDIEGFKDCPNLEAFSIETDANLHINSTLPYICKVGEQFYISNQPIGNDWIKTGYNFKCYKEIFQNWNNKKFRNKWNSLNDNQRARINDIILEFAKKGFNYGLIEIFNYIKSPKVLKKKNYVAFEANDVTLLETNLVIDKNIRKNKNFNLDKNYNLLIDKNLQYLLGHINSIDMQCLVKDFSNNIEGLLNLDFSSYFELLKNLNNNELNKNDFYGFYNRRALFKLYYNLGALGGHFKEEKRKDGSFYQVNYNQKITDFLKDILTKNIITIEELINMADNMNHDGFKKEFADFFIGKSDKTTYNIQNLLMGEREIPGFVANCYNKFEEIQRTNTSHKGSQRTLKPTYQHFKDTYMYSNLEGVNEYNEHIAITILKYFNGKTAQESFDTARIINAERLGYNFKKVKDKTILFAIIDAIELNNISELNKYKKYYKFTGKIENIIPENAEERLNNLDAAIEQAEELNVNILKAAINIAEHQFSAEWLDKADPENLVLGKLCDCCAHIQATGKGIMRASIIHPDVQNLVIRNKKGEIVAKSTIYVNRKKGYAVFNNVEVNETYSDSKTLEAIYKEYIKAVQEFGKNYNAVNKKPLKVITVGMNRNDLFDQLTENNERSKILYDAIHYGRYNMSKKRGYPGDSHNSQYVVFKKDDSEKEC